MANLLDLVKYGLIYKATSPSGRCYIGQTTNLKNRINQHKNISFNENCTDFDTKFHKAIRKYGIQNFKWEVILDEIPICLLDDLEIEYIREYNSYKDGYNSTIGGEKGNLGISLSQETKNKISQTLMGHKVNLITKEKIGKANSVSNKGKKFSLEHCEKISNSHKGDKHPMYGKKHSEETKRKQSESRRKFLEAKKNG